VKRLCFLLIFSVAALSVAAGETKHHRAGSNTAPVLDEAAAQNAGLDSQTAATARRVYTTKCMRCHKSYEPSIYSQPQWEAWMVKMRKKAHLSQDQDVLLSRYLDACRAASPLARTNLNEVQRSGTSDER
jgi:cytochrome c5